MDLSFEESFILSEETPEEKELLSLSPLLKDFDIQIKLLSHHESKNFYGELTAKIRSLIYEYIKKQGTSSCSPIHKYLYLFYTLYQELSDVSFMKPNFLINFLFKRIFLFFNSLNSKDFGNIKVINASLDNLCRDQLKCIIYHCMNLLVNKFIFEDRKNLAEINYIMEYFQKNEDSIDTSNMKNEIAEIFFTQLICLDDFIDDKNKDILKDEAKVKKFIEDKVVELYQLNMNNESGQDQNEINIEQDNDKNEDI
jgi:hypothetical protein